MSHISDFPDDQWKRYECIEMHTEGEPLRLITAGFPEPQGTTVPQRRLWAMQHLDEERRALMLEPRGHADMYGAILTPPNSAEADAGVLFLHNEGFSTMCGHGVIAVASAILRYGLVTVGTPNTVRLDTPAGHVTARVTSDCPQEVQFLNVASFVEHRGVNINLGEQTVAVDIAFGGAYYAFVNAADCGLRLVGEDYAQIVELGRQIKQAVMRDVPLVHPSGQPDLEFLYGVIFCEAAGGTCHSRQVCVFADGEVDRSPTGTGVSARAALLADAGEIALGEQITIESIVGGRFHVFAAARRMIGDRHFVYPEVRGRAWMTGHTTWVVEPEDPLKGGFLLR